MASTPTGPARPTAPRASRRRALTARVLVVLAAIFMVLALVAGYARRTIVDSDQFANRATAALRDESVRTVIAERVTDEVVLRRQADLLAARPLIESAVSGIVGGGAFSGLFRTGVRDVHRAVFDRDENTITLTIADVGTVLSAALEKLQPSVARQVRPTDRVEVLERHGRTLGASVADAARVLRVLAIVVPLLCLALAAAALWASPDRRRTVAELGVGAACAGVAVVVLLGIARSVARPGGPRRRRARRGGRGLGRVPRRPAVGRVDPRGLRRDRHRRRDVDPAADGRRRAPAPPRRPRDGRAADDAAARPARGRPHRGRGGRAPRARRGRLARRDARGRPPDLRRRERAAAARLSPADSRAEPRRRPTPNARRPGPAGAAASSPSPPAGS